MQGLYIRTWFFCRDKSESYVTAAFLSEKDYYHDGVFQGPISHVLL